MACFIAIMLCSCSGGKKSPDAIGFTYSEEFQNNFLEKCIMIEEDGNI